MLNAQLVFIPGLVSDSRVWSPVATAMESLGYKVAIADVSHANSLTEMAQQILSRAEPDQALIPIGHSMGGRVALEVVRLAPDRVVGLGLVATGAHPLAKGELAKRESVIALAHEQGMQALCNVWLPPMLHPDTAQANPALFADLQAMVLEAGADVHERQIRALVNRPDAMPLLPKISCPTLLVAGEADGWSSPEQHQQMMDLMTGAKCRLDVVTGAGHFLQSEKPEQFAAVLSDWLKSFNE